MSQFVANVFERRFNVERERTVRWVHILGIAGAALFFAAVATLVMSFNTLFLDRSLSSLEVGDVAPREIDAPISETWISDVLTEQARQAAVRNVEDVYDLPDPNVARQQTQFARNILDFINNVRRDPYASTDQKLKDLSQITALELDEGVMLNILEMDEEVWRSVDEQIEDVLERVLQQSIRESDLRNVILRLPTQVSVRFDSQETGVITEIVGDLVRPNTFVNAEETELARERAANDLPPVRRTFVAGQRVVDDGRIITEADYEALQRLGVLEVTPQERLNAQLRSAARSFLVSLIVLVVIGLFTARFSKDLFAQPRVMVLGSVIYLLFLIGARAMGVERGDIYIYPTAAMALLFVSIIGPEVAIVSMLGLALMVGFMIEQRLELTALIGLGGMIGTLSLRRAERLNSYFFAGMLVALANVVVIIIFNLGAPQTKLAEQVALVNLILFGVLNGVLSAAAAMALMYLVTLLFNLPTGLRLVELSQPNQPLLQRLLRDAPGTYQHSLQVANLAEQATSAVGGNAELVRVSALYHDIGKSLNAPFFVENQADGVNPHDELGDPYRSADIIISHVTEGDRLARQHRIPARVRDFIMEHHGTTRVEYFYRQALANADNPEEIDPADFTYPGPAPQSRETAIMMLADSCESTVRARRPSNKQEIQDIVQGIIDARTKDGQLDASGLTSNDIKTIRTVFVDMLQAVFHPRINYPSGNAPVKPRPPAPAPVKTSTQTGEAAKAGEKRSTRENPANPTNGMKKGDKQNIKKMTSEQELVPVDSEEEEDDVSPLPDVPALPRRATESRPNEDDENPGDDELRD